MAVVELTKDNFEQVVTSNSTVIVDYWAPWCGPCRGFAPVFEKVAEKNPDVVFAKVNTDEEQEIAAHFQIRSIPPSWFSASRSSSSRNRAPCRRRVRAGDREGEGARHGGGAQEDRFGALRRAAATVISGEWIDPFPNFRGLPGPLPPRRRRGAAQLLAEARLDPQAATRVQARARELVEKVRSKQKAHAGMQSFLREYDLSSQEGVLLMCVAEACFASPTPSPPTS
jgi:thioredoxin